MSINTTEIFRDGNFFVEHVEATIFTDRVRICVADDDGETALQVPEPVFGNMLFAAMLYFTKRDQPQTATEAAIAEFVPSPGQVWRDKHTGDLYVCNQVEPPSGADPKPYIHMHRNANDIGDYRYDDDFLSMFELYAP